ncbi:MAG: hypothetical protein GX879_08045, partial [Bacteroidales bacterium]|nr:hypothetical protein [Bacteroidales bacterium]
MLKNLFKLTVVILLTLLFSKHNIAQNNITCHGGISAQVLIADTLINGCLTAHNITANNGAYGYFKKNNSQFPFASGIIMSTGPITNAQGPNTSGTLGGIVGSGSDPDLAALVSGSSINDACVIQFDFIPADDVVEFRYIFGSEEFPEFANSDFNDVFGFFLSGPGINGPYSNNAVNIALLPNGQPVTIDNVHNGGYYYAYPSSSQTSAASYHGAVQYDGNTIVLTATAQVIPCETYHIKLAIGDRGDSNYDSGMFLESGSFTSGSIIEAFNISEFGG